MVSEMTVSFEEVEQTLWGSNKKHLSLCRKWHLTEFHTPELVRKHFCHPPLNINLPSVGGFLSSLSTCLVDAQVLSVYILPTDTAFVPEMANFATIGTCFTFTAGMVGSVAMFAFFLIAALRTGTSVSYVVFRIF